MTSIRPQCTKIAMSLCQESSYGIPVEDVDITKLFEPNEPVILEPNVTRRDDSAMIHGNEWPVDPDADIVETFDVSIPFTFPCSLEVAGLLYALAMQTPTLSGRSPNYIHTMKALDACTYDSLPSTSWVLGFGSDTAATIKVKGLMINELTLDISKKGRLDLTGTAFTDGTTYDDPTFTFPTTSSHAEFLTSAMGDFKVDGVTKKAKLRGMKFSINNNLDLTDARSNIFNAGIYLSQLRFGNRAYTLSVKVDGHQGDEFWDKFIPDQYGNMATTIEADINLTFTDGIHGLFFNFPTLKVNTYKMSFDGLHDVIDIEFKTFYNASDATPVTIQVINNIAQYLTQGASPSASLSKSASVSTSSSPSSSPSASA